MADNVEEAFEKLYKEMFPKLKRIAASIFHDEHTAEDIAQDTLLVTYDKRENVLQLPEPKKWVYGVLQNKIKHELRSKARFTVLKNKLESDFQETKSDDDEGWEELLVGLSYKEYQLLHMIYVEGYSNKEAAEKLNISYAACRKQAQRAKEKIRQKFQ